jgi:hypothetical protein
MADGGGVRGALLVAFGLDAVRFARTDGPRAGTMTVRRFGTRARVTDAGETFLA